MIFDEALFALLVMLGENLSGRRERGVFQKYLFACFFLLLCSCKASRRVCCVRVAAKFQTMLDFDVTQTT
jgi:hypothetical protein